MNKNKVLIIMICVLAVAIIAFVCDLPHINAARLVEAIKAEDYDRVEKLLVSGIDPNVTTSSELTEVILNFVESTGERPLSVACKVGNLQIVKLLIDYGATAEPHGTCGWSPLNQTLLHYQPDDKEIVELLLSSGADIYEDDGYGIPIFNAASMLPKKYNGQDGNKANYIDGYDADTASQITDIVKLMLEYGNYDVNVRSPYQDTTLLITAVKCGNINLAEYLLSEGCDMSAVDITGKTALDYAKSNDNTEMIAILKTG